MVCQIYKSFYRAVFILIMASTLYESKVNGQVVSFVVLDPASGTGCKPLPVLLQNNSDATNTQNFIWNFGDGSPEETYDATNAGQTIAHTYIIPGQFSVQLKLITLTGETWGEFHPVRVYDADIPQAQSSAQILCGGDVLFSNISNITNAPPGARTTIWDFGDGTIQTAGTEDVTHTYSFAADSTYTVKMTDQNMCGADSTTIQVTIYHADNQINVLPGTTVCVNNGALFSNSGHKDQMTYSWDFLDGTTSTDISPTHEYISDGNYLVSMAVEIPNSQQCSDTVNLSLTVLPGPKASFIMDYDTTCNQADVPFRNVSTGPSVPYNWAWDFGNGETSNNYEPSDTINYDSTGNYIISLIAESTINGCSDTSTQVLFVPSSPLAIFSADNVCLGQEALFTDLSITDPQTPIQSWSWDFGGGQTSTDQNPSLVSNTPGPQAVSLNVATDYCDDDTTIIVVVEDLPHPNVTVSSTEGCSPLVEIFTNNTPDAARYQWIFGDMYTDTAMSPVHKYLAPVGKDTSYTAKLIACTAFGCKDSLSVDVIVHYTPEALFTHDASTIPFCTRDTVTFTSLTHSADMLEWYFGNGQTGSDSIESCIFTNTDPYFRHYQVSLVAISDNGCRDTSETTYISVYPRPRSDFVPDTSDNCNPATISFYAPVEANAQFAWDFGDGNALQTVNYKITHGYNNPSTQDQAFTVKLITESEFGCKDSTTKQIFVHADPVAGFTMSPNPVNTASPVTFTNLTENHPDWYYRWQFGIDNLTDTVAGYEPAPRSFSTYYDVPVSLLVRNKFGCEDTVYDTLDIIPPPPLLDFSPDTLQGCPLLTVSFTDRSDFTDTTTYQWDFGDGGYSNAVSPVHTFYDAGMFMVTLTARGLDLSYMSKDTMINVFQRPSATFTIFPEEVYVPDDPVKCVPSYPSGGETYFWNFGDGDTSALQEPLHYYQDTGRYSITLIVINENGCSDTLTREVLTKGTGKLKAPNVFFAGGGGAGSGGGVDDGATIDDGSTDNSVFAPLSEGVVDYHLEIYTRWGEKLFSSDVKNYGWTGYYHGRLCKEDVYVWKVTGTFSNGEPFIQTGTITLLHDK
jgi:PKD repeat protein